MKTNRALLSPAGELEKLVLPMEPLALISHQNQEIGFIVVQFGQNVFVASDFLQFEMCLVDVLVQELQVEDCPPFSSLLWYNEHDFLHCLLFVINSAIS